MNIPSLEWSPIEAPMGLLVGCDNHQEWLLPWWFMNFRIHNDYPVTFLNFGDMSAKAIQWCQRRGRVHLLECDDSFVAKKENIEPSLVALWEKKRAEIWRLRPIWLRRTQGLLKTSYEKTLWVDLDCQIVGSLNPIFQNFLKKDFAVVQELEKEQRVYHSEGILCPGEMMFNGGVVGYVHGAKIVQEWASRAISQNHLFMGGQHILSRILFENELAFSTMPNIYNWAICDGKNPDAVILHYWGAYQKILATHIRFCKEKLNIDLGF